MKSHLKICPTCGSPKIRLIKKDLTFTHRGRKIVVPRVECEACPDCGEVITDMLPTNTSIQSCSVRSNGTRRSRRGGSRTALPRLLKEPVCLKQRPRENLNLGA